MNRFYFYLFSSVVIIGACWVYALSVREENRPDETSTFPEVRKKLSRPPGPIAVTFTPRNEAGFSGSNTRSREDVPVSVTLKSNPKTGTKTRKNLVTEQMPPTVVADISPGDSSGGKPVANIPTRIPSTNGRPDQIFTLEGTRKSMPNAYMGREIAVTFTPRNEAGFSGSSTRKREDVPVSVTLKSNPKTGTKTRKNLVAEQMPPTVVADIPPGDSSGGKPVANIPTRIPSTNGRPDQIFTLEGIRESMPNAYMVHENAYPPENLTSSVLERQ